ncbi:hypothetical protein [Microbacterium sp. P04]|uniref:hypothetical protein n=1 Tax=Microbacterium sp. P04 TaxID=3366947 RepID=UPI0037473542
MLGALHLVGCAASAPGVVPDGLTAELVQLRGDLSVDRVQVHLENDSDEPVTVTGLTLSSPAFTAVAQWDGESTVLQPGRAVNLPVFLPPLSCAASAEVTMAATFDDGAGARAASTPLVDELGALPRLVEAECARERTEAVARVTAVAAATHADGTARVSLEIEPVADAVGTVRLVGVRGTPLLRFPGTEQWPLGLTLDGSSTPRVVEVPVEPRRCDPHAIAEDKVGTRLTLVVEIDGEELAFPLPRTEGLADTLLTYVAASCGLT